MLEKTILNGKESELLTRVGVTKIRHWTGMELPVGLCLVERQTPACVDHRYSFHLLYSGQKVTQDKWVQHRIWLQCT